MQCIVKKETQRVADKDRMTQKKHPSLHHLDVGEPQNSQGVAKSFAFADFSRSHIRHTSGSRVLIVKSQI